MFPDVFRHLFLVVKRLAQEFRQWNENGAYKCWSVLPVECKIIVARFWHIQGKITKSISCFAIFTFHLYPHFPGNILRFCNPHCEYHLKQYTCSGLYLQPRMPYICLSVLSQRDSCTVYLELRGQPAPIVVCYWKYFIL